jgi:hypothetical protein
MEMEPKGQRAIFFVTNPSCYHPEHCPWIQHEVHRIPPAPPFFKILLANSLYHGIMNIHFARRLCVGVGSNNVDFVRFASKPTPRYPNRPVPWTPTLPQFLSQGNISLPGRLNRGNPGWVSMQIGQNPHRWNPPLRRKNDQKVNC